VTHTVTWIDREREPKCPPNPAYPDGITVDLRIDKEVEACVVTLDYPAQRCGLYVVQCHDCGLRIGVTTAGRPDDPREVIIPCRKGRA
jgi:hypothetical protein